MLFGKNAGGLVPFGLWPLAVALFNFKIWHKRRWLSADLSGLWPMFFFFFFHSIF